MAIFKQGDIFEASGMILFGACSSVNDKGTLMMDPATSTDLCREVPGICKILGKMILDTYGDRGVYGLLLHGKYGVYQIGYRLNETDLNVFNFSMSRLSKMACMCRKGIFNIYYPYIADGKTDNKLHVLVEMLPDNVHVWTRREVRYGIHADVERPGFMHLKKDRMGIGHSHDPGHRQGVRACCRNP